MRYDAGKERRTPRTQSSQSYVLLQYLIFADIIKTGYPIFRMGRIYVEGRTYAEEDTGL